MTDHEVVLDAAPAMATADRRFEFLYADAWRRLLCLAGLGPRRSGVTVASDWLTARLGWCQVRSPLDNIAAVRMSGPYRTATTLGVRVGLLDDTLTLGTNTRRGLRIRFHQPVPISPSRQLTCTTLTVTVANPAALGFALTL